MKVKKLKNLIFFFLAIALYCFLSFKVFTLYGKAFDTVLYSVLGLFLTVFLNAFLHELGHLIFGKLTGLKLISFKVLCFKLSFENKVKISLEKVNDLGETVFVPKNDNKVANKVAISIFGGLLSSFLLLVIGLLFMVLYFDKNLYLTCLMATPSVFMLYYLVVNLIGDETCDGYQLLNLLNSKNNNKVISSNALYIGSLLFNGVSPTEIDYKYLSVYNEDYSLYSTMIIYYRYLSLISVNEEYAFKEILKISDKEKLCDTLFDAIICELYYVAYLKNDKIFLKNNQEIIERIVEYDNSLYALRAHAVLRIFTNENEWAKIIIEQALVQIGDQKSGIFAVEKLLFNKLKVSSIK